MSDLMRLNEIGVSEIVNNNSQDWSFLRLGSASNTPFPTNFGSWGDGMPTSYDGLNVYNSVGTIKSILNSNTDSAFINEFLISGDLFPNTIITSLYLASDYQGEAVSSADNISDLTLNTDYNYKITYTHEIIR